MQKVVDWFEAQSPASWNVPLGIMLGDLDPTISAKKALRVLEKWVTLGKALAHSGARDNGSARFCRRHRRTGSHRSLCRSIRTIR